jgi:hypothetical protein
MRQNLNFYARHLFTFNRTHYQSSHAFSFPHCDAGQHFLFGLRSISMGVFDVRVRRAIPTLRFRLALALSACVFDLHFRLVFPFDLRSISGYPFSLRFRRTIWACAYVRACGFEPFGFAEGLRYGFLSLSITSVSSRAYRMLTACIGHSVFDCDSLISSLTLRLQFRYFLRLPTVRLRTLSSPCNYVRSVHPNRQSSVCRRFTSNCGFYGFLSTLCLPLAICFVFAFLRRKASEHTHYHSHLS